MIDKELLLGLVELRPNPASLLTEIVVEGGMRLKLISVYDANGKLVLKRDVSALRRYFVQCYGLERGLYTVELKSDRGVLSKKLLVE